MNNLILKKPILGDVVALILTAAVFFMALDSRFRVFAYPALFVFIFLISLVAAEKFSLGKWNNTVSKNAAFILFFMLYIFVKDFVFILKGVNDFSGMVYPFFGVLFVSSFVFMPGLFFIGRIYYLFSYLLFVLGLVLGLCAAAGANVPVLDNFIPGFMVPLAIYNIYYFKFKVGCIAIVSLCLLFGVYFGARGGLLIVILSAFFVALMALGLKGILRYVFYFIFSVFLIGQLYVLVDNSILANQILTYRPVIWNYYFLEAMRAPFFGNGPIVEDATSGAARAYQAMVERGVGELYGPHSMYLRYMYESGVIGLISILLIIFSLSRQRISFEWVVMCSYSLAAFFSSGNIGQPSLYSTVLLLSMVMLLSNSGERDLNIRYRNSR